MSKLKKIKLSELVNEPMNPQELLEVKGGIDPKALLRDGCYSGICSQRVNTNYCDGGAVCTSGIAG